MKPEIAEYIAETCTGLRELAEKAGMTLLAHLLRMVILQAEKQLNADTTLAKRRAKDGKKAEGN